MATARAVPFAVAVSRRFAHIADGGLRGLAAHRLEKPEGGTGWRPKRVSRGCTARAALPRRLALPPSHTDAKTFHL